MAPYGRELLHEKLVNRLTFIRVGEELTDYNRRLYKISIFYILFLLCAGVGPHPEAIDAFCAARKMLGTAERLKYLLSEHETLVWRGSVAQMAVMALVQADGPYSRGLFWDCFHAFYLTYVSILFSKDQHFSALRVALKDHPNGQKIIKPSEQAWTHETRPHQDGNYHHASAELAGALRMDEPA